MRTLLLALALLFAGCDTPTAPQTIEGVYDLLSMEGTSHWFDTPASASGGALVLDRGTYTLAITWTPNPDFPEHEHTQTGTYRVEGGFLHLSGYDRPARMHGDTITQEWGASPITVRWLRQ